MSTDHLILGSRSPRRLQLLAHLLPPSRIRVLVPADEQEAGFSEPNSLDEILLQLAGIARTKNEAVFRQLGGPLNGCGILSADTVVIVPHQENSLRVLGKPDGPDWEHTTRVWFQSYFSGKSHQVATALCLRTSQGELLERQVLTTVQFCEIPSDMIEWYLSTQEPLGKAGAYALQGAASCFVTAIHGSPSNVIGLPLLETRELLQQAGLLH